MIEHNPDVNANWKPKVAWRVYACSECGQETEIQTNHTGTVWSHRCTGTCRNILNPHSELERVFPKDTKHEYVSELVAEPLIEDPYTTLAEKEYHNIKDAVAFSIPHAARTRVNQFLQVYEFEDQSRLGIYSDGTARYSVDYGPDEPVSKFGPIRANAFGK